MSLKAVHIFFITVSSLFAFAFSGWLLLSYTASGSVLWLIASFLSFAAGIGLIVYGVRFLRKLKHVSNI